MTAIFSYVNEIHRASGFTNEIIEKKKNARRSLLDREEIWTAERFSVVYRL